MGYTHDTHMAQFINPKDISKSAGTWTTTMLTSGSYVSGSALADVRTAADATFNLYIPILLPSNASARKGAYLTSIEVLYTVTTAALDSVSTPVLVKTTYSSTTGTSGSAIGTFPALTIDTLNDTSDKAKAIGFHRMIVTLTSPAWIDNDEQYVLSIGFDAASTTAFHIHGAIANFTLRV